MTLFCGVKMMTLHQFHHVNRTKNTSISQVHCAIQYNQTLFNSDDENPIIGQSGNPFTSHPNNPFIQQPVHSQLPAQTTVDTDATTIISNTMSAVASKKLGSPNSPNSRVELHLGHPCSSIAGSRMLGLLFWSILCPTLNCSS